eukprot:364942-Chlamydomonas_euryale.AAC.20
MQSPRSYIKPPAAPAASMLPPLSPPHVARALAALGVAPDTHLHRKARPVQYRLDACRAVRQHCRLLTRKHLLLDEAEEALRVAASETGGGSPPKGWVAGELVCGRSAA